VLSRVVLENGRYTRVVIVLGAVGEEGKVFKKMQVGRLKNSKKKFGAVIHNLLQNPAHK